MAFLDDFRDAVSGYPAASVTVEIVDRAPVTPPTGTQVNINDIWSFQVRVRNNGQLNMTGVSLRINGLNGATVSTSNLAGSYVGTISSFGNMTIPAHGTLDTVNLFLKAPNATRALGTELVSAQIAGFDVNLNHLLIDHTAFSATPRGVYADQVFPS